MRSVPPTAQYLSGTGKRAQILCDWGGAECVSGLGTGGKGLRGSAVLRLQHNICAVQRKEHRFSTIGAERNTLVGWDRRGPAMVLMCETGRKATS